MVLFFTIINSLGLAWVLLSLQQSKPKSQKGIILDSCALIDGRILEVVKAGFVHESMIVPQFVLRELQMLADGSDNHKRARARHGLEVSEELRALLGKKFIIDTSVHTSTTTDDNLLLLAKKLSSRLCTTDYNLNKVAASEGVVVLNVNELARAMRPTLLPGEEQEVKIIQKGEGKNQGVGYLEDGAMVVVDGAAKLVGTKQIVVIERSLQTVAGKMSFAHVKQKDTKQS